MRKTGRYLLIATVLLGFCGVLSANTGINNISSAMGSLCATAKNILAVGVMLLVVLAAIIYSVGQILGAETRARATVWATAMITGAIIGIIIYVVVPTIVGMMMGSAAALTC